MDIRQCRVLGSKKQRGSRCDIAQFVVMVLCRWRVQEVDRNDGGSSAADSVRVNRAERLMPLDCQSQICAMYHLHSEAVDTDYCFQQGIADAMLRSIAARRTFGSRVPPKSWPLSDGGAWSTRSRWIK